MGWFAGCFPRPGAPSPPDWPPLGGRPVWERPRALSLMGAWAPYQLRTVSLGEARLAVFGQCLASEQRIAEDFALALRGHRRYEPLTRWPGSYALVVSDPDGVTILTDLAGQYPVFTTTDERGVAYCSLARPLADRRGAEPDTGWLAATLLCPGVPEATVGLSPYRRVRVLPGGQALRITPHGMRRWASDPLAPDRAARFDEAAEALRAALTTAVHARMSAAQRPTADFSGGLDSTSLAFLAAAHTVDPLPAFTYHNPLAPAGDDLACAQRAAALEPRLDHRILRGGPETLAYQELATALPSDEPDTGVVLLARTRARFQAVSSAGSDLHLTGEGGDVALGAPLPYLADLVRRRHLGTLVRHCAAWGTLRHRPPAALVWAAWRLARTLRSRALRDLAVHLVRPEIAPAQVEQHLAWWTLPGPETAWVTARARRQVAERLMEQATAAEPAQGYGVGDHVTLCDLRAYAAGYRLDREAAAALGVSLHAPYLDNEVVRACLRLPAQLRGSPFVAKPLLGAALRGLVPDLVLARRTKGDYTGEEYQGVRRAIDALRALLADPLVADLGLVEPAPVRVALDRALLGLPVPFAALRRVLAVELWLRHLSDHALIPPEAAGV